jgi:hypothetical protein
MPIWIFCFVQCSRLAAFCGVQRTSSKSAPWLSMPCIGSGHAVSILYVGSGHAAQYSVSWKWSRDSAFHVGSGHAAQHSMRRKRPSSSAFCWKCKFRPWISLGVRRKAIVPAPLGLKPNIAKHPRTRSHSNGGAPTDSSNHSCCSKWARQVPLGFEPWNRGS